MAACLGGFRSRDLPRGRLALIGGLSSRNATLEEARWILPRIRSTRRWLRFAGIALRWMFLLGGILLFALGLSGPSGRHSMGRSLLPTAIGIVFFALGFVVPSGRSDEPLPQSGEDLLVQRFRGKIVMEEVSAGKGHVLIPTFEGCWPLTFPMGWGEDFHEGSEVDIEAIEHETPGLHGRFDQALWVVSIRSKRSLQAEASAGVLLSPAAWPGVWWMAGVVFLVLLVWQPRLPAGVQLTQVPGILRGKPPAPIDDLDGIRRLDPGPGRALRLGRHVLMKAPGSSGRSLTFVPATASVEPLRKIVDSIQRRKPSLPVAIERARKEWESIDKLLGERIAAEEIAWWRKLPSQERDRFVAATYRQRWDRIERVRAALLAAPDADSVQFAGNAAWLRFARNRAELVRVLASGRDSFVILRAMADSREWYQLVAKKERESESMATVESLVLNDRWNGALKEYGLGMNSGVAEDSMVWLLGARDSCLPWDVEGFPEPDGLESWVDSAFHQGGRIVVVQSKTRQGWFLTDGSRNASDLFGWFAQWSVVVALVAGWIGVGIARSRRWMWAKGRARQVSLDWWAGRPTREPGEST